MIYIEYRYTADATRRTNKLSFPKILAEHVMELNNFIIMQGKTNNEASPVI